MIVVHNNTNITAPFQIYWSEFTVNANTYYKAEIVSLIDFSQFDYSFANEQEFQNYFMASIAEFTIESVHYDWVQQKAIITLTNGEVLEFACSESWTEADCIAAIQSVPKYANAIVV